MNEKCSEVVETEIQKDITDSEPDGAGKEIENYTGEPGIAGFGNNETYRQAKMFFSKGEPESVERVDDGNLFISPAYKETQQVQSDRERRDPIQASVSRYEEEPAIKIVCADFFPWCLQNLGENSVDLILTDPPYPRKFLHVWGQLGEVAFRVLKPGGYLATYSGQYYLTYVMRTLEQHLSYCWTVAVLHNGPNQLVEPRNAVCSWKPILIFRKGQPGKFKDILVDCIHNDQRDKRFHKWGQGENAVSNLMGTLSNPNDLVLDPFAGGGTTLAVAKSLKRRCVGIEIDPRYIDTIKRRCA